ncbi:MAG TPA: pullulanase-type alpha-1,6-glucosidase [Micromonosporaceae bacterium]
MDALPAVPGIFHSSPAHRRRRLLQLGGVLLGLILTATLGGGGVPTIADVPTAGVHWDSEPSAATLGQYARHTAGHGDQFYFVLPDRFANGDPGNDRGGLTGDRMSTGYDPTDKGFYHGGDIQGVIDKLDYIQGLGTTAIWLAPVFKNRPVQGTGANASAGYHGYWITDFTQVDPHFGTNEDLRRLVTEAHKRGLKIFLDIIVNHTADVISYQQNQYAYRSKTDYPYKDASGQPFDDRNYADGTRGFPKVNTQSFPYTPVFADAADAHAKSPDWLNDPTMYHNRGDSTFSGENAQYGDFYGLDDLWTERPDVVQGMTKIYQDWVTKGGVDGYRIDTVKHVDDAFWPQFTAGVSGYAAAHDRPNFFMFGEVYSADPEFDAQYVRTGGLDATLDFPFQAAASGYAARGGSATDLANLYAQDPLYRARGVDATSLPTFLGNHDMGRIGYFITTGGQDPATYLKRDQLAHELMFLTRGQPIVYSGDEQGFTGTGGDKDARQDMFASKVADYVDDPQIGTTRTDATDEYDPSHPMYRTIAALSALRRDNPGLRDGVQVTRYAASGAGVFAFSRIDPNQRVEYLVATNNDTGAQTVTVPTYSAGMVFDQIYPAGGPLQQTGADRTMTITVPALSTVVLRARSALPAPTAAPTVTLKVANPAVTRARIDADVTGDPLTSVAYAYQIGDGPWTLLGSATSAPYTIYHDLAGLAAGTKITYKAVARDSAGHLASVTTSTRVGTATAAAQHDYVVVHYQRPDGNYDPWGVYAWGDIDPSAQTRWPNGQPFAGQDSYGRFAWVKLNPGARNVGFLVVDRNGVKDVSADRTVDPTQHAEIWLKPGDPTIYASQAAATGVETIHYHRPDGQYTGWGLHLWGDGLAPGAGTDWGSPRAPDGVDSFGAYWRVPIGDATKPVNFIVHKGDTKDPGPDMSVVPADHGESWITSGENVVHPTRAAAEHVAVLHYRRPDGDYTGWGLHVWTGAANPTDWGSPLPPAGTDPYGAVYRVPLADGATSLSYIVHKGDTKDLPADQSLDLVGVGNEVWLLAGQQDRLLPMAAAVKHDLDLTKAKAQWIDRNTVAWRAGPTDGRAYALAYAPDGGLHVVDGKLVGATGEIRLDAETDGLTETQRQKYPNLWQYTAFTVDPADRAKIADALRGQVVAVERDADGNLLSATGVQIPGVLDDLYSGATSAALGVTFADGRPTVAVWAPTAHTVALEVSAQPGATPTVVPMTRDNATGVWRAVGDASWKGKFYRFRVSAYQPATGTVQNVSVTDPYSVSLSTDSQYSQIVDLSDPTLAPNGWSALRKPGIAQNQVQVHELSVRDFSIADPTVPAEHRGTYLAFTDADSAGMTHLRALAKAGVTHIQLMPVFDIASIPERRADQQQPPCDLAGMAPDSDRQQACIAQVKDHDGYNWGYDPYHYTTPEGSYATDPEGTPRIVQFRQMVQGLNDAGLKVVMDVVYNHTPAAGTDKYSVLDQIVPGYYQRLLDDGTLATSTCCANTAPEHAMMGKLVVDSVVTWAKYYKIDGFRFDLMGHHPKANILAVRAALDKLTLGRDGVDGKKIVIWGEGWNFGEVANNARFVQATQANMAGTGIGTFNDRLRDAVRGGGPFDSDPRIQGFASGLYTDPNGDPVNGSATDQKARLLHDQDLIQVGLTGNLAGYRFTDSTGHQVTGAQVDYNGSPAGYTGSPAEAVTYVDAHDNEILYDALAYKLPQATSPADRARMQVLALSTTVFSQGVGFVTAGSDLLRSKSLDGNSYNSGDWFNAMLPCSEGNGFGRGLPQAADNAGKWPYAKPLLADPALVPDCATMSAASQRYAELVAIRSSSPLFHLATADEVQHRVSFPLSGAHATPGVITMVLSDTAGPRLDRHYRSITVVFNATPHAVAQTVPGFAGADVTLHPVLAGSSDPVVRTASFDTSTGTFHVPARTVAVFVQS